MSGGRRPITDVERPHAVALGQLLRSLRDEAGLTQRQVGALATLTPGHVGAIERGERRTRRSTLERIVAGMLPEQRRDALLAELVEAAGPALAPESDWAERVAARRAGREHHDARAAVVEIRSALRAARRVAGLHPKGHPRHERTADLVAGLEATLADMEARAARAPAPSKQRRARPARRPDKGPAWHALQQYAVSLLPPGRSSGRLHPTPEQSARLAELRAAVEVEEAERQRSGTP